MPIVSCEPLWISEKTISLSSVLGFETCGGTFMGHTMYELYTNSNYVHVKTLKSYSISLIKGLLISEGNFGVFKSPKNWTFFVRISALASKMGPKMQIIILLY